MILKSLQSFQRGTVLWVFVGQRATKLQTVKVRGKLSPECYGKKYLVKIKISLSTCNCKTNVEARGSRRKISVFNSIRTFWAKEYAITVGVRP